MLVTIATYVFHRCSTWQQVTQEWSEVLLYNNIILVTEILAKMTPPLPYPHKTTTTTTTLCYMQLINMQNNATITLNNTVKLHTHSVISFIVYISWLCPSRFNSDLIFQTGAVYTGFGFGLRDETHNNFQLHVLTCKLIVATVKRSIKLLIYIHVILPYFGSVQ